MSWSSVDAGDATKVGHVARSTRWRENTDVLRNACGNSVQSRSNTTLGLEAKAETAKSGPNRELVETTIDKILF